MLARQGSLQYAIKKQAIIAEAAQKDQKLIQFFKALRIMTVVGAVSIGGAALGLAFMAIGAIVGGTAMTGAYSFILIALFMLGFAALLIATEGLRAKCVARFFGFMSLNVWKGLYCLLLGMSAMWIGNVYKVLDDYSPGATTFDTVLFIIGIVNVCVGLAWMAFGGCNFIGNETTPLKEEFANYAAAMRMFQEIERKERQTGNEQVTVTIKRQIEGTAAAPGEVVVAAAAPTPRSGGTTRGGAASSVVAIPIDVPQSADNDNPFRKKKPAGADPPNQVGRPAAPPPPQTPPPPPEDDGAGLNPFAQPPPPQTPPPPPEDDDAGLNPFAQPAPAQTPPPPPEDDDAGLNPFAQPATPAEETNPFDVAPASGGENPFGGGGRRPATPPSPLVTDGDDALNPFSQSADAAGGAGAEDEEELQRGEEVYYSHRTMGPVLVKIVNIDVRGVFDGGITYLVEGAQLDGAVETVRNRLSRHPIT